MKSFRELKIKNNLSIWSVSEKQLCLLWFLMIDLQGYIGLIGENIGIEI